LRVRRASAWAGFVLLAFGAWAAEKPPSIEEQRDFVAAARQRAVADLRSIPDYICAERITRYRGGAKLDTLSVRLSYYLGRQHYDLVAINERPSDQAYETLAGLKSHGEFGGVLASVLAPGSRAQLHFRKWTTVGRRAAAAYGFDLPLRDSDFELLWNQGRTKAGLAGDLLIDRSTFEVLGVTYYAAASGVMALRSSATVDYAEVEIGRRKCLLPVRATMRMTAGPTSFVNDVEFLDYRKFSSESKVIFNDGTSKTP
jgi:hypothetical protein